MTISFFFSSRYFAHTHITFQEGFGIGNIKIKNNVTTKSHFEFPFN